MNPKKSSPRFDEVAAAAIARGAPSSIKGVALCASLVATSLPNVEARIICIDAVLRICLHLCPELARFENDIANLVSALVADFNALHSPE